MKALFYIYLIFALGFALMALNHIGWECLLEVIITGLFLLLACKTYWIYYLITDYPDTPLKH